MVSLYEQKFIIFTQFNLLTFFFLMKTWIFLLLTPLHRLGFPGGSDIKETVRNEGDPGSIPVSGVSPRKGNVYSLQYSCLENFMDQGVWQATVHRVAKS